MKINTGKKHSGLIYFFAFLTVLNLACASTVPVIIKAPPKLNLRSETEVERFKLEVEYYDQNVYGATNAVSAYQAQVELGRQGKADTVYWKDYKVASAKHTGKTEWGDFVPGLLESMEYLPYLPAVGLEYLWPDGSDLTAFETIPGIREAPKDMEGFRLYLHAIDLFTAHNVYPDLIRHPENIGASADALSKPGDTYFTDLRNQILKLMDWPNIGKNLIMQTGFIELKYLADTQANGKNLRLYSFQQNQRFGQTLTYKGLIMPMDESTRFMGHIWLGEKGELEKFEFQEYVYVLVHAPMGLEVPAHVKRHFVLERINSNE